MNELFEDAKRYSYYNSPLSYAEMNVQPVKAKKRQPKKYLNPGSDLNPVFVPMYEFQKVAKSGKNPADYYDDQITHKYKVESNKQMVGEGVHPASVPRRRGRPTKQQLEGGKVDTEKLGKTAKKVAMKSGKYAVSRTLDLGLPAAGMIAANALDIAGVPPPVASMIGLELGREARKGVKALTGLGDGRQPRKRQPNKKNNDIGEYFGGKAQPMQPRQQNVDKRAIRGQVIKNMMDGGMSFGDASRNATKYIRDHNLY